MSDPDIHTLQDLWVQEASQSDLGLWWLARDVRKVLGPDSSEEEVRRTTIQAIRPLLESGRLRVVDLLEGGRYQVWPGDVASQLSRIELGWREVGIPDIGDVAWFLGERET
jgi:hypothetical protein